MSEQAHRAIAIVGVGAILPDAPDAPTFWQNIQQGKYSITKVSPDRWDPDDYYDPDPRALDKTYSKIGGWVREYAFDPFKWRIPIPPKVLSVMDDSQKWAIATCRAALLDYGYPDRPLDVAHTAVILGNAMAGENHYITALRVYVPEFAHALEDVPAFNDLPPNVRQTLLDGMRDQIRCRISEITEDTMPGELSNIIAGRVANVLNLGGPSFVTDAACASSFAALHVAVEGLVSGHFDAALTGGIDRNMGAVSFVKFSKIGALSPDGSRPYAEGANGFVMGEGAAAFLLKRLKDAERDGDSIYAVIRGIGGSSDGKGKGITAPNPIGQQRAIERGWKNAGLCPATATYVEGHGTSTRVGDVVEVESLGRAFSTFDLPRGSIALGSVKSNFGHLKSAAGAAALLKTIYALRDKVLPPAANFHRPNPEIDFDNLPFCVNTELRPWDQCNGGIRRAGVSSFGFGGTNFHMVVEEHIPGTLTSGRATFRAAKWGGNAGDRKTDAPEPKAPYRGILVLGAPNAAGLQARLKVALTDARAGNVPSPRAPAATDLSAAERLAIDFEKAQELVKRGEKATRALQTDIRPVWKPLASQGVFRGRGKPGKVAFLFPGQGSQYVNMLRELCDIDPVVAETFREADEVMTPLLGRLLTDYVFVDAEDKASRDAAEAKLRDTTITQPAVLTVDVALSRLLVSYGITPDMVIGHSLGEYAALVTAGVLSFADALRVVSARGHEMSKVSMEDNGCMAAIFAPLPQVEHVLSGIEGYVVLANINSRSQVVIGGATQAVDDAIAAFQAADCRAVKIPVSHAFHTRVVAPASEPLKRIIARMDVRPPRIPIVANVTGQLYPGDREEITDILGLQVASPVQFVKGVETLYREGARVFVEVGPKRVLKTLAENILSDRSDVTILFTNHPRKGALPSLNEALCGLYAAGVGAKQSKTDEPEDKKQKLSPESTRPQTQKTERKTTKTDSDSARHAENRSTTPASPRANRIATAHNGDVSARTGSANATPDSGRQDNSRYLALGRLFADLLEQGQRIYAGMPPAPTPRTGAAAASDGRLALAGSVVVSGAALGLPGQEGRVFDDQNIDRILRGEQFIELIPYRFRIKMAEKRITYLAKRDSGATFEVISDPAETIKLAGRRGQFDLASEFGVPESRVEALDISTQLAIGAGIEGLRDAGIPLVMHYRTTSKGTYLPGRWMLPEALADETGIIFASAFPGLDRMADEVTRFNEHKALNEQLKTLNQLRAFASRDLVPPGHNGLGAELDRRIADLEDRLARLDYSFDRRFIFRVLAMGHSQFAEYIGARGPNTHVNAACATTTHAIAVAEDWIRIGRCRRVIVVAGDDVTSENLMEWIGSGLLATGATTTEERLDKAALPFDRRRNGTIIGMGAAAIVVEAEDAVRERGMRAICEVLSSQIANSAFHGTRLDVEHICEVMDRVVSQAEGRFGIDRYEIAPQTVFVSHETYTPARGGSAAAEIHALRATFGDRANQVVIANTKGYTGHAMGVGIEDVLAIKALERGIVPPVANIHNDFQPDPGLGDLNLSRGGRYPVQYALRLGAGFGSQIAMTLLRRIPGSGERVEHPQVYDRWLTSMAGYDQAELEVENRTLRIHDAGPPVRQPARSTWQHGRGPTAWASAPVKAPTVPTVAPQPSTPRLERIEAEPQTVAVTPRPPFRETARAVERPPTRDVQQRQPEGERETAAVIPPPHFAGGTEGGDPVAEHIRALVSEKTGYPPDMLDLDLDLEADLGIDTVKQAQVFATIREVYDIPRRDGLRLRDYDTLAKVIAFVHQARADLAPRETGGAEGEAKPRSLTDGLEAADRIPRRVPVPLLRPDLEICKPTGVTFGPKSRMAIISDDGKAGKYLGYRLRARKVKALILKEATPEKAASQIDEWLSEGPIAGVYFLPALDVGPPLSEMDLAQWRAQHDKRVKTLYTLMRALPQDAFLICGTRMGGLHGYTPKGATAPLGGAVTGFAKAYAMERPDALVKAVDFAVEANDRKIAEQLIDETLRDPGVVEVGYHNGQRFSVGLVERPANYSPPDVVLDRQTVFVVTGGAGGITASIVTDLARSSAGTFYLTDIAPAPDPDNPDLARLGDERKWLKRDIAKRMKDSGIRPTPVGVGRALAALERAASILTAMEEIERAGGTAHYRACDVTDAEAVAALVGEVKQKHGRIDVLIHAAGLERSHFLADKEPKEFNLIFDVKADGLFNLLRATQTLDCPLKVAVVFSSIAGRFGNAGQTDYSAASDLMCKITSSLRATRPETKAVVIDWSAWAEVGMATRGSIPEMMRRAGIDMLDPESAVPVVRREIIANGAGGEVVIARSLGILLDPPDPDGGLDLERANEQIDHAFPVAGRVISLDTHRGFAFEVELDPQAEPFLHDHALDGTPLLPGVMGIEGFAEVASLICSGLGSGGQHFTVTAIEDVRFEAPLKFYRQQPRTLTWRALVTPEDSGLVAHVTLESARELKVKQSLQTALHFSGRVHLEPLPADARDEAHTEHRAPTAQAPNWSGAGPVEPEAIYRVYFHGPAFQVLDGVRADGNCVIGKLHSDLPPITTKTKQTLIAPRLIELCLQTAGVWEIGKTGTLALPTAIERVIIHRSQGNSESVYAEIEPKPSQDDELCFDARVIDQQGNVYLELQGYRTARLPDSVSDEQIAPIRAVIGRSLSRGQRTSGGCSPSAEDSAS